MRKTISLALIIILISIISVGTVSALDSSKEYTATTETSCSNGLCHQTIYSGTEFVNEDGVWKHWTDAKSLKDKGFKVKVLETDEDYPLEVVDFNATSITVDLKKWTILNKNIPLKLWEKNSSSRKSDFKNTFKKVKDINEKFTILDLGSKRRTYDFAVGDILEFGPSSTTIILTDGNIIGDVYTYEQYPDTNYDTEYILLGSAPVVESMEGYLGFNISSMTSGKFLLSADMSLYLTQNTLDVGHTFNMTASRITGEWNETGTTWNNAPAFTGSYGKLTATSGTAINTYYDWNVTTPVSDILDLGYKTVNITIQTSEEVNTEVTDYLRYNSRTAGSNVPKLTITYLEFVNITYPLNITYSSDPAVFNWTIANTTTLDVCKYSLNSAANVTVDCLDTNKTITSIEGPNTIIFYANQTDGISGYFTRTYIKDEANPDVKITYPLTYVNYLNNGTNLTVNWTRDTSVDSCWYDYSGVNISMDCNNNLSIMISNYSNRDITFYVNDSGGNENLSSAIWNYHAFQNLPISVTDTSYAGSNESYIINISSDGTETMSAVFYFNGTKYNSTKTGSNFKMLFTNTINLDSSNLGNNTFYWAINYSGSSINTTNDSQFVKPLIFGLCNVTFNTSFINFTFKDEDDLSIINASIDASTFNYWLGGGSAYQTLIFTNLTDNFNYDFCLDPGDKTLHNNISIQYSKTGYPQRRWTSTVDLTNVSSQKTLYLLSTADGTYSVYQVQTNDGSPISGVSVTVERQFSGTWTIVEQGTTDSVGAVTFWLNSDFDHRLTFTKTGYSSVQAIVRPSSSTYTVVMGTSYTSADYSSSILGIKYWFSPAVGRLDKDTVYTFELNVTSNQSNLVNCRIRLLNSAGALLNSTAQAADSTTECNLWTSLNTSAAEKIFGELSIDTGSGYFVIDSDAYWLTNITNYGTGGLWKALDGIRNLEQWGDENNRAEFSRVVGFFFFIAIILSMLSFFLQGWEMSSPGAHLYLLWVFFFFGCATGFLELSGLTPSPKLDKWFVFWLATLFVIGKTVSIFRRTT